MILRSTYVVAAVACVTCVAGSAGRLDAQRVVVNSPPLPLSRITTNTVTIAGTYSFAVGALTQTSIAGPVCSPGACYVGGVTARANRGWQLQVQLASVPNGFTVAWVEPRSPYRTYPLTTTTWQTVGSGAAPTAGQGVAVWYYANKTNGKGGSVPSAAELAAVLRFQVVASP